MKKIIPIAFSICLAALSFHAQVHASAQITIGADVNLSKLRGQDSDPTIAINPNNSSQIVVFSSHFRGTQPGMFHAYSTDAGTTWTATLIATGTDTIYPSSYRPWAAFDQFGNLFLTYTSTANRPVLVASFDGGATFVPIAELDTFGDNPRLAIGRGSTATTSGVWIAYEDSFNGVSVTGLETSGLGLLTPLVPPVQMGTTGLVFDPITFMLVPGKVPTFGAGYPTVAVGAKGQVAVGYTVPSNNNFQINQIMLSLDSDGFGPNTFTDEALVTNTNVNNRKFIPASFFSIGLHTNTSFIYDLSNGPYAGRIYCVYCDESGLGTDNTDIQVRYSDNDGTTFSHPGLVNQDGGVLSQFMPSAAVDPVTGALAVAWMDCRSDAGNAPLGGGNAATNATDHDMQPNTDSQVFGAISTDGGVTFNNPQFQVSSGSQNGNMVGLFDGLGDYIGVGFVNNTLIIGWGDNSNSTGDNADGPRKA